MPDTIREQIIAVYAARMSSWTTVKGFTHNCGSNPFRAVRDLDVLPAAVIIPGIEEAKSEYGMTACEMSMRVEALAAVGTVNPSIVQEQLLGDVIKIMTEPAPYLRLTFALAGYVSAVTIDVGKTVTGGTSTHTGTLLSYNNTTRTWIVDPDTPADTFDAVEPAAVTSGTGAGTFAAAAAPQALTTLTDGIEYKTGGPAAIPQGQDTLIGVFAEFTIFYNTLSGNPYSQS